MANCSYIFNVRVNPTSKDAHNGVTLHYSDTTSSHKEGDGVEVIPVSGKATVMCFQPDPTPGSSTVTILTIAKESCASCSLATVADPKMFALTSNVGHYATDILLLQASTATDTYYASKNPTPLPDGGRPIIRRDQDLIAMYIVGGILIAGLLIAGFLYLRRRRTGAQSID
ncbi:MAG: hypothetical protein WB784_11095 [Rhodanobacteraceae bacterium]